ncbi:MAG: DMT family transporter [Alphaproteobacteria bacterium]|nr:DMT family transporter [Alphaproteobacteria bacterium]
MLHSSENTRKDNILKGVVHMCTACFLFTFMYGLNKMLAGQHHVVEIAFYRNMLSMVFFLSYVVFRGRYELLKTQMPGPMALRVIIGTTGLFLTFWATQLLPLSNATVLFFASTLMIPLLAIVFLKEKIGWNRWAAIIVGLAGVIVAAQPSAEVTILGILVALGAACAHAGIQILLRLMRSENPLTITFYFFLGGAVVSGLLLPWFAHWPTRESFLILMAIGLVGGAGQYFLTSAFQLAPASLLAPFNYTGLIWATLLDIMMWGILPGWPVYAGAALIISAQLYILHRERVHGKRTTPDELLEL